MEPVLVLIPGLGGDAAHWSAQVAALSRHVRVCATQAHFGAASIEAMADAILSAVGPAPLILCGTSMGGFVALEICRRTPARVRALALLGTSARAESAAGAAARRGLISAIAGDGFEAVMRRSWQGAVHPDRARDAELGERILASNRRVGETGYISQLRAIIDRPDALGILPALTCPVVVMRGSDDGLMPADDSEELVRLAPHAEYRAIPHCGHMPALEQPAVVTAHLKHLLGMGSGVDRRP